MQREARRAEREVERQRPHADFVEGQRIAPLPGREVPGLVAVVQFLPAILYVAARHVAGERVVRVVAHEARQVARVPIRGGPGEHRRDLGLRVAEGDLRRRASQEQPTAHTPRPTSDTHRDRKSTRLNSSHGYISYAVFCLKKKKKKTNKTI